VVRRWIAVLAGLSNWSGITDWEGRKRQI
jgi:hypothetical protein